MLYHVLGYIMKMGLVMKYTSIPQILLHILKEHDEYYHLIYNLLGNSVMIILNIDHAFKL